MAEQRTPEPAAGRISVIIPLWNGRRYIAACLDALLTSCRQSNLHSEIIVVDNGSTDGSAGLVAERYAGADLHLIRNRRNLGFAGGCNVGLRAARGERLLLLNQDTQVDARWLAVIAEALVEPGIVGSLAFLADGRTIQHAGGIIEWPLGIARHLGYGEPLQQRRRRSSEADFVTAAAMGIHRAVLDRVGLFDELFWPGYYEDADLCYRARETGYSVRLLSDAILIHQESASFRDRLLTDWARLRGRLRFVLKHRTPEFFLAHFLPAEERHRAAVLSGDRHAVVARAYLEAIPMVVDLWQARATADQIRRAAAGLQALYAPPPFHISVDKSVDKWDRDVDKMAPAVPVRPILTPSPWERVPVLGPLWGRLRRALHRLVIFYVERRESRLAGLVHDQAEQIARLQAELAQLRRETEG